MSWVTLPGAGAPIYGDEFMQAISELRPIVGRKTGTETVNNSSAIQADDELFIALAASTLYFVEIDWLWSSGATPDIKFDFTSPAGISGSYNVIAAVGGSPFYGDVSWTAGASGLDGDGTTKHHRIYGPLLTGASAGTLAMRWAQSTANLSNTQVFANSVMRAWKLG